jgi:hypothetical protein
MSTRRRLALALALAIAGGAVPALVAAQAQATGTIAGRANDEAKKPYTDYTVRLRDAASGLIAGTTPLDQDARFTFNTVTLSTRYVVELFNTKKNKVVCTEGPYALTPSALNKLDVNINCGATPAAWWLLVAGAAAGTVGVLVQSGG